VRNGTQAPRTSFHCGRRNPPLRLKMADYAALIRPTRRNRK
jgi:hypothetical protein